jgi:hypothetical protein
MWREAATDVLFRASGSAFRHRRKPLAAGQFREVVTGRVRFEQFKLWREEEGLDGSVQKIENGYDIDAVEDGATYECAHCGGDIAHRSLKAMLAAYEWRQLNPKAPRNRISALVSALYSPFERWGQIAKKFLLARGSAKILHDFHNSDLGLPFVRCATTVSENDIDLVVKRCPRPYVLGQLPFEPEVISISSDVGALGWWWVIRAWGILWDHPEQPTWSALVDYGSAVSWDQIEELAGLKPDKNGNFNRYTFRRPDGTTRELQVTAGIIDAGFDSQTNKKVYEFCVKHSATFSPAMGRGAKDMRGSIMRQTPASEDKLDLILFWDDWFKQQLYYANIKEGRALWFLPTNLDNDYKAQLTAERTVEQGGKLVWEVSGEQGNHIGDAEKLQEVLREWIEERFDAVRAEREAEEKREQSEA